MFTFVQQEKGAESQENAEFRRFVRSHAMKDFRRKQREAQGQGELRISRSLLTPVYRPLTRRQDSATDDLDQDGLHQPLNRKGRHNASKARTRAGVRRSPDQNQVTRFNAESQSRELQGQMSLPLPTQIAPRAARRMQLFANFFESHLPVASSAETGRAKYISFLTHIPFLGNPSALLNNAVDALCLAHVASSNGDVRLLHASQTAYGLVLSHIRRMVETPSVRHLVPPAEVIVSIMLIGLFDEAMPHRYRTVDSSYMMHIWGAQQYLGACNPNLFDLTRPLDRSAIQHVFQSSCWLGIARRQGISFRTPEWTKAELAIWPNRKWYHIYESVPGLLERTDGLLSQGLAVSVLDLLDLCHELTAVRQHISIWRRPELDKNPPEITVLTDKSEFSDTIEEHRFFRTDAIFDTFLRFPTPESGVNSASLSILLLLIDCTLLRIYHFRPDVLEHGTAAMGRSKESIEQDATALATDLCRIVYYFSTLESEAYADFQKLVMSLCWNYFTEQGLSREARWCRGCIQATNLRIKRLMEQRRPTLCRISGLPLTLINTTRFKAEALMGQELPPDFQQGLSPERLENVSLPSTQGYDLNRSGICPFLLASGDDPDYGLSG